MKVRSNADRAYCVCAVLRLTWRAAEDTNVLIYVMMAIIGVMTLLCIVCLLAAYLLYKRRSKNMLDFLEDGDDEELFPL